MYCELFFDSGISTELSEMHFRHPAIRDIRKSIRGKCVRSCMHNGCFQWTSAVSALSLLLVRGALQKHEDHGDRPMLAALVGRHGSTVLSLDYALSKQPMWLLEMFGTDANGNAFARRLLQRTNPDHKRPGPVIINLSRTSLNELEIHVSLNGQRIQSYAALLALERSLELGSQHALPKAA